MNAFVEAAKLLINDKIELPKIRSAYTYKYHKQVYVGKTWYGRAKYETQEHHQGIYDDLRIKSVTKTETTLIFECDPLPIVKDTDGVEVFITFDKLEGSQWFGTHFNKGDSFTLSYRIELGDGKLPVLKLKSPPSSDQ